jgi:hypothetical protein
VPARFLPDRPSLDQLKRQAKRQHVAARAGNPRRAMLKPPELDTAGTRAIWDALTASAAGDVETLRGLLGRDTSLSRAEYWYTPAIHFAVRDGHDAAVRLLLDAGASPPARTIGPCTRRSPATTSPTSAACSTRHRTSCTSATSSARHRCIVPSAAATTSWPRCSSSAAPTCTRC